jgi:hypothetical protein
LKSIVTQAALISIHAGFSDPKYPQQLSVQGCHYFHCNALGEVAGFVYAEM